ncbi:hypothetical protein H9L01_09935 [Erysipelothrix inopinata]|uniref:YolD-like family protein n=1 Tax=Erysipelothrix inopinata TaxID=225084 RepID=A0A7G9RYJ6_9FIRM|nr:hypothetical protein [Erysipelothrix inopinata]QNN60671.1 hypothetical protein H9L01_09935 [Erysipelothrix inopinata]
MERKRTKKVFVDYNDYHDRPFGLKWGTAFSLAELTKVITEGQDEALNQVKELPIMSRLEIDEVLQYAFLKSKTISIQLNIRDDNQNLLESIVGKFEGIADDEYLYLGETEIAWESIRNIAIVKVD